MLHSRLLGFCPAVSYTSRMRSLGLLHGILAVLVAGVMLLPYAKPLTCHTTDHPGNTTHQTHQMARDGWNDLGSRGGCHDAGNCAVVQVAPVRQPTVSVSALPSHREPNGAPVGDFVPFLANSLTPPPKA